MDYKWKRLQYFSKLLSLLCFGILIPVFRLYPYITGLEEVMEFLEQSFPNVEIAIAHGKVFLCVCHVLSFVRVCNRNERKASKNDVVSGSENLSA